MLAKLNFLQFLLLDQFLLFTILYLYKCLITEYSMNFYVLFYLLQTFFIVLECTLFYFQTHEIQFNKPSSQTKGPFLSIVKKSILIVEIAPRLNIKYKIFLYKSLRTVSDLSDGTSQRRLLCNGNVLLKWASVGFILFSLCRRVIGLIFL